jgi:ABC-type polar amino acid transport system ATPase subunit
MAHCLKERILTNSLNQINQKVYYNHILVIIMIGSPGSGKSTFVINHL